MKAPLSCFQVKPVKLSEAKAMNLMQFYNTDYLADSKIVEIKAMFSVNDLIYNNRIEIKRHHSLIHSLIIKLYKKQKL